MRVERDSMGEMQVPDNALFGASTQRAVLNFPISDLRFSRLFIRALGFIKLAAAMTNQELGLLDQERAKAIIQAATEVSRGDHYEHFVLDIFQTGSGTSTNMNANEVIANRALEIMGSGRGDKGKIHPNDHVNMCQSSNDVIPTAIHVATEIAIKENLLPNLKKLAASLDKKSKDFAAVIKSGRTHLQDATPITLGQEFSGYATQIANGITRIERSRPSMLELALGGTAVGTGLNTHPEFAARTIRKLSELTGSHFVEAPNHFEAQGSRDAAVEMSGQLRVVATSLMKIANDIRWLASGPRCNIFEIELPEVQPGSSIMPAKVNPVICESAIMVCARVFGNDATVAVSGQQGNFELNTMLPVIGHCLLESVELLASTAGNFAEKCIDGITANTERCLEFAEKSLATCTSLAPKIGYDKAAQVAKTAYKQNKTVRETARELGVLSEKELSVVLNLEAMTKPGL